MNAERKYMRRIVNAINYMDGLYENGDQITGVKGNEIILLYALDDGQPHTQKQLCTEWMMPRTTVNTIIKKWEKQGYLVLQHVAGTRREMEICLTSKGKAYADDMLKEMYKVEDEAMRETLAQCSPQFIEDFELFVQNLSKGFAARIKELSLCEHDVRKGKV